MKPFKAWSDRFERFKQNVENFDIDEILNDAAQEVQANYDQAIYSGTKSDEVTVSDHSVVLSGTTAMFIEFGTGVMNAEHDVPMYHHGTYGKGRGNSPNGWVYAGDPGNSPNNQIIGHARNGKDKVRTIGEPAQMPVYKAYLNCIENGTEKLKEVLK